MANDIVLEANRTSVSAITQRGKNENIKKLDSIPED